jgi:hypothetical protein
MSRKDYVRYIPHIPPIKPDVDYSGMQHPEGWCHDIMGCPDICQERLARERQARAISAELTQSGK